MSTAGTPADRMGRFAAAQLGGLDRDDVQGTEIRKIYGFEAPAVGRQNRTPFSNWMTEGEGAQNHQSGDFGACQRSRRRVGRTCTVSVLADLEAGDRARRAKEKGKGGKPATSTVLGRGRDRQNQQFSDFGRAEGRKIDNLSIMGHSSGKLVVQLWPQ